MSQQPPQAGSPRQPPPRGFAAAQRYLIRSFLLNYRTRFLVLSQGLPSAPSKPRPNVPMATHELLLSVAGVVVDKWEKMSTWVLAALAAVSGVAVANYDKVAPIVGTGTVRAMWWLMLIMAFLHAAQRVATTFVQATEAGAKAGKDMGLELTHPDDLNAFLDGMVAAYPWFAAPMLRRMFDRMQRVGIAPFSKLVMNAAFTATLLASAQLLLGLTAIVVVAVSLYSTPVLPEAMPSASAPAVRSPAVRTPASSASSTGP